MHIEARSEPSPEPPTGSGDVRLDDDEVLARVLAGQEHAFEIIVARYGGRITSYLCNLLGSPELAEDLAQDAFANVLRKAATRDGESSFSVWLYRIARNLALDHLRRRRVEARVTSILQARHFAKLRRQARRRRTTPEVELDELKDALGAALLRLPEDWRSLFLLRTREELSYEEIAQVMGLSPKTVSTRLHRVRRRLQEMLGPLLAPEGAP